MRSHPALQRRGLLGLHTLRHFSTRYSRRSSVLPQYFAGSLPTRGRSQTQDRRTFKERAVSFLRGYFMRQIIVVLSIALMIGAGPRGGGGGISRGGGGARPAVGNRSSGGGNINRGNINQGNVNRGSVNQGSVNRGNINQANVNRANVNQANVNRANVNQANV